MSKTKIGFGCYDGEAYDNREPVTISEAMEKRVKWEDLPYRLKIQYTWRLGLLIGYFLGVATVGLMWLIAK